MKIIINYNHGGHVHPAVEMTDGSTLQESMAAIVSDVENTQNDITDVHNELMTSLGGMTFGVDAAGRYGYIKAGADTVTPFKKDDYPTIANNIKYYAWYVSGNVGATMGRMCQIHLSPHGVGTSPTAEAIFGKGAVFLGISKVETSGGLLYGGIYNIIPFGVGTTSGKVEFSMRMDFTQTTGFSCTVTLIGYKPSDV